MAETTTPQRGLYIVLYGPSKTGKTTAAVVLALGGGRALADPGAILPVQSFLAVDPSSFASENPQSLADVALAIKRAPPTCPALLVDDLSLIADRSFKGDWNKLGDDLVLVRDATRDANAKGIHVVFTAHEVPPRTSSGKWVRGGPALPGQYPERFCAYADVVARVMYDDSAQPWQYILRVGPQPDYVSGDRVTAFPAACPMNLAEGFRAAGYNIPRPPALTWMEGAVESGAAAIAKSGLDQWRTVLRSLMEKLNEKARDPRHVRWVLQDALHRAQFRMKPRADLDNFLKEPEGITI